MDYIKALIGTILFFVITLGIAYLIASFPIIGVILGCFLVVIFVFIIMLGIIQG